MKQSKQKLRSLEELRHAFNAHVPKRFLDNNRRREPNPLIRLQENIGAYQRSLISDIDGYRSSSHDTVDGGVAVVDMFSGCGGMSTGFRTVNGALPAFKLTSAVDIDEIANQTYERNLGFPPKPEDVSALAKNRKRLARILDEAEVDAHKPWVLIGCAPCQGFSSHRNSKGARDSRNPLFTDFAAIASTLKPDAVIIENVPELLTDKYWGYVKKARAILERSGYWVQVSVHNMAEFGVPQERFRAVMVAMRRPFAPMRGILDRGSFRTVRDAIGDLPPIKAGARCARDSMHFTANHSESTLATIRAIPKNGGNRPDGVGPRCLQRAKNKQGRAAYEDVYGRLHWDRPAVTITAYARNPASGRFVHPTQHRGLSVREAALLQGFPSDYWFEGSLEEKFRQIGNAVPPLFAACLATHVLGEMLGPDAKDRPFTPGIVRPMGASFSRFIPAIKAGYRSLACC